MDVPICTSHATVLGAAGLSLSLASGASAVPAGPALPTQNTTEAGQNITLGEEEIADVTLATFYVFDKENDGISGPLQLVGPVSYTHLTLPTIYSV